MRGQLKNQNGEWKRDPHHKIPNQLLDVEEEEENLPNSDQHGCKQQTQMSVKMEILVWTQGNQRNCFCILAFFKNDPPLCRMHLKTWCETLNGILHHCWKCLFSACLFGIALHNLLLSAASAAHRRSRRVVKKVTHVAFTVASHQLNQT